ncbi:Serine/threonine-protein phosphatase 7 long form [Glycine soja]
MSCVTVRFFLTLASKPKQWHLQLVLFFGNNTFIDVEKYVTNDVIQSYAQAMPSPNPKIETLLVQAGFSNRPESHTFHLLVGECTITLEDVVLQLGLHVGDRPNKSGNIVYLTYLPLLTDFDRAGLYNWGLACLAHLYEKKCIGLFISHPKKMGGCTLLLQSWTWYCMSFIQPRVNNVFDTNISHLTRWSDRGLRFCGIPCGDVIDYMSRFDNMHNEEFHWMPYKENAYKDSKIWSACVPLICFLVVERHKYVLISQPILGNIEHMSHYMNWYRTNSKICLTQFATYPNIGATSRSAPDMETEQYPAK